MSLLSAILPLQWVGASTHYAWQLCRCTYKERNSPPAQRVGAQWLLTLHVERTLSFRTWCALVFVFSPSFDIRYRVYNILICGVDSHANYGIFLLDLGFEWSVDHHHASKWSWVHCIWFIKHTRQEARKIPMELRMVGGWECFALPYGMSTRLTVHDLS